VNLADYGLSPFTAGRLTYADVEAILEHHQGEVEDTDG